MVKEKFTHSLQKRSNEGRKKIISDHDHTVIIWVVRNIMEKNSLVSFWVKFRQNYANSGYHPF